MLEFHWLRSEWLWAGLPLILLGWKLLKRPLVTQAWAKVCDAHLLQPLLQTRGGVSRVGAVMLLLSSLLCMIIALAGPAWVKNAVPTYQHLQPRLIVLDLSESMLEQDVTPDRLTRAKFKIHDILKQADTGQLGLLVYTDEPFVVSPLTEDAQTMDGLLDPLSPTLMPVSGNRLDLALNEAYQMLTRVGLNYGEILVLTAQPPSVQAVEAARHLASSGYHTSVIPLLPNQTGIDAFSPLTQAGQGEVIAFTDTADDLQYWLKLRHTHGQYRLNQQTGIPVWRDEGRWFLLPALMLLLPIFRRGWLTRVCR